MSKIGDVVSKFLDAALRLRAMESSDSIAEMMAESGVKGQLGGYGSSCAAARWLQQQCGADDGFLVSVGPYGASVRVASGDALNCAEGVVTWHDTAAVSKFIERFDDGEFPHLIEAAPSSTDASEETPPGKDE